MLPVDQTIAAVGGFAACKEKGVTALAHQGIRAEHRLELHRAIAKGMAGRAHQHPAGERLVVAARPGLVVVDEIEHAMRHQHPVAVHDMQPLMHGRVRLPCGARGFAGHGVGAERARHRHRSVGVIGGHGHARHFRRR